MSPDPTLTVENVMEVMSKVADIEQFGRFLRVPLSKCQEMVMQSKTEKEKTFSLAEYWLNTDPHASWRKLGNILYHSGEERAAAAAKQYFPTGIFRSLSFHFKNAGGGAYAQGRVYL